MSDFVSEKPIEIIVLGRKFGVIEPNGALFDAWIEKYVKPLPNGNYDIDISSKNKGLLEFIVDAPYDKEGVAFKDLSVEDRVIILQELKPILRAKLLKEIETAFEISEDEKKN